tara:strand:- start:743 stop:922 length:180 start_codon:yes stop_codon:yes gene_type:complete
MLGTIICEACSGNGYRRIWEDTSETKKITIQCASCDSKGEIIIADEDVLREINGMKNLQ